MVSRKMAKILEVLSDLQERVAALEAEAFPDAEAPTPTQTLYDRQTRLDEFVPQD